MAPLITAWSLDLAPATTSAPFIHLLSTAQLPSANFNTWLHNDFLYVRAHTFFLSRLISLLPPSHSILRTDTLLPGYKVLAQELDIFRAKALERGVNLPVLSTVNTDYHLEASRAPEDVLAELEPHAEKGCVEYMRFIALTLCGAGAGAGESAHHWTTLLAVLWMCEKIYLDSMVAVRDSEGFGRLEESVKDFVRWWSTDEFAGYIKALEEATEGVRGSEGWREEEAKWAVGEVLRWERGFWDIATQGLVL